MSEQISSGDSLHSEANILRRIVEQLRVNLYTLEEQAALHSPLDMPLRLKNAIEETTKQLGHKEAQLRELQSGEDGKQSQDKELKRFWEPFVSEGAKFFVSHDAPDDVPDRKVKVTALTMQAVFNMYRLLVEQFADSLEGGRVQLEVGGVLKHDTKLERLAASSHPHLIVIGAPGSHPLSNYLMAQFKGIPPDNSLVRQGYVFRVSGQYLGSPFIVSDKMLKCYSSEEQAAMQEIGIYDLKPGHPPRFFPRTFAQHSVPGNDDQDCAIIMTGWASLPGENRIRRVVIIAGHSGHSTLSGTALVATNEEWAQQVNALSYFNTETIIGLKPDPSGAPVTSSILASPREIYKQQLS
jgi:hypothetical protein